MFTGIIEHIGKINKIVAKGTNLTFWIESTLAPELKVDQSLAHNGTCLTVEEIVGQEYAVTAIDETLQKTNLGKLKVGDMLNLERAMVMNGRLDGHIVQGHVDQIGRVKSVKDQDGSWIYHFEYDPVPGHITIEKGSICVNGVSLTCFNSDVNTFSVAIIPYTYEHTNFKNLRQGDFVNLEFDVLGKYVKKLLSMQKG
ncbi:MAG: riboflavin synthase [Bacteroidota bacterium]|nr:riboflavin synthase [Bacteroidota bacterium]